MRLEHEVADRYLILECAWWPPINDKESKGTGTEDAGRGATVKLTIGGFSAAAVAGHLSGLNLACTRRQRGLAPVRESGQRGE